MIWALFFKPSFGTDWAERSRVIRISQSGALQFSNSNDQQHSQQKYQKVKSFFRV
jgi:hypothetical protein